MKKTLIILVTGFLLLLGSNVEAQFVTPSSGDPGSVIHDSLNVHWVAFTAGGDPGSVIHDSLDVHWSIFTAGEDASEADIGDSITAHWAAFTSGGDPGAAIHDSLFANTPGYATNAEIGDSISDHWAAFLGDADESEIHDSLDANWTAFTSDDTVDTYREAIADTIQDHWAAFIADNNDTVTAYRAAIHDSLEANWSAFTSDDTVDTYREAIHDSLDANWTAFTTDDNDYPGDSVYNIYGMLTDTTWDMKNGFAWTGAHDFGGATSLELPNAADPTTDAGGEIAWDSNDDAIEVYMGDESESALLPIYQKLDAHIFAPDGVNDQIAIFRVDALLYPFGIEIDQVSITIPADAEYSMVFEEWAGDPPVAQNDISTVTTGAGDSYAEEAPDTDAALDADDYIFLDIPATDVDWIHVQVIYHVVGGN